MHKNNSGGIVTLNCIISNNNCILENFNSYPVIM